MIHLLLRKDPALRLGALLGIGGALIAFLFTASMVRVLRPEVLGDLELGRTLAIAPVLQIMVAVVIALASVGAPHVRATEYHLALPVPPRAWVATRILGLLFAGWAPLLGIALAALPTLVQHGFTVPFLQALGADAIAWGAAVGLLFAVRPARRVLGPWPLVVAVVAAGLGLFVFTVFHTVPGAALSTAVAVAAVLSIARGVPNRMVVVPRAERTGPSLASAGPRFASPLRTWVARRTVLLGRNLVSAAMLVILAPNGDRFGLLWYVLVVSLAATFVTNSMNVLRGVGALPVPRSRLARWVLLPPLVLLSLSLVGGEAVQGSALHQRQEQVDLVGRARGGEVRRHVQVPSHLHELVWGSAPRSVRAPWGESVEVHPRPLVPGLPVCTLNRYDIEPGSSLEFVAWQLERAARDAYGLEPDPATPVAAHLSMLDGEVVGPSFGHEFELEHYPLVLDVPDSTLWLELLVAIGLWWLVGRLALVTGPPPGDPAAWRRSRNRKYRNYALTAILILSILLHPLLRGGSTPNLVEVVAAHLDRALAGHVALLALPAVALAVAGYSMLARRFARIEVPPPFASYWDTSNVRESGAGG